MAKKSWALERARKESDELRKEIAELEESNTHLKQFMDMYREEKIKYREAFLATFMLLEGMAIFNSELANILRKFKKKIKWEDE